MVVNVDDEYNDESDNDDNVVIVLFDNNDQAMLTKWQQ